MDPDTYNYAVFPAEDDVEVFARFAEHLKVGQRAPDVELIDLESSQPVRLSSFTTSGLTVVEFGSLT